MSPMQREIIVYIYLITYRTIDGNDHKLTVTVDNKHPQESIIERRDRAKIVLGDIAKRHDVVFTKITQRLVPGI
jgi:hypothetical protein